MARAPTQAYEYIRLAILDGRFPPDTPLREQDLAATIGVSRTPVREALRQLAADGFVRLVPNQGASVVRWSRASLIELIEVRGELAGMAARLAATNIDDRALSQLDSLNAQMSSLDAAKLESLLTEGTELNLRFHAVLFDSAGNRWVAQLMKQTAYLPLVQRAQLSFDVVEWQRAVAHYSELIEALKARDGEWAASILRAHFRAAKHAILRSLP